MMPVRPGAGALALAALLAGCTTAGPPAAVLSYASPDCRAAPDLGRAIPLMPGRRGGATVRTQVDAATPCLEVGGFKSPYLVYSIGLEQGMIDIGGAIEAARVFPPSVALLDAGGATVRTFAPAQFLNRGDRYSVQFVPQQGERYILVTADRSLVGSSYEAVATGTTTRYFGTGYWTSGIDRTISRSRSYEGAVVATVYGPAA